MARVIRRAMVAANWKMNGSKALVARFAKALGEASLPESVDVIVMPPVVLLPELVAGLVDSGAGAGAQDLHAQPSGAYTGEIAGGMLSEAGARWVLTGHSERRQYNAESNDEVATKFAAALRADLTPVLCVGETLEERDAGREEEVVTRQIRDVLNIVDVQDLGKGVLAYEPVWAIGTGRTASPDQAQAMHAHIRAVVAEADESVGQCMRILYGGSVKPDNALALFEQDDIDGGLIGGAGLEIESFLSIVGAAGASGAAKAK